MRTIATLFTLLWLVQGSSASSPSLHSSKLCDDTAYCHKNAECFLANDIPFCECSDGYEGDGIRVCSDMNECINDHDNFCDSRGGGCVDNDPPQMYSCFCQFGFLADTNFDDPTHGPTKCIEVNPCMTGSHQCDDLNGICLSHYVNATQSQQRSLRGGLENVDLSQMDLGYSCSCEEGYFLDTNGKTCTMEPEDEAIDEDPCDPDPCDEASQTCSIDYTRNNNYLCRCKPGFFSASGVGGACKYDSPCALGTHDCNANADCVDIVNSYFCVCRKPYIGAGRQCAIGGCSKIGDCDGGGSTCRCLISEDKSMCGDVAPGPVGRCSIDAECGTGKGCINNFCVELC